MAQGNLQSVYSYSIAGAHLLQLSLVKGEADKDYMKQYFCFLSIAPGVQGQNGRTYDMKNGRLNLKIDVHQAIALGHEIEMVVKMMDQPRGRFLIYVDSSKSSYNNNQGGAKMVWVARTQDTKNNNANQLTIFFKQGNANALGMTFAPAIGLAFADICKFIGNKGLELEFGRIHVASTGVSDNTNFAQQPPPSVFGGNDPMQQQMGQQPPPAFGGDTMGQQPPSGFGGGNPMNQQPPQQTPQGVADNFAGSFPPPGNPF